VKDSAPVDTENKEMGRAAKERAGLWLLNIEGERFCLTSPVLHCALITVRICNQLPIRGVLIVLL
jgi:hypothetical protein